MMRFIYPFHPSSPPPFLYWNLHDFQVLTLYMERLSKENAWLSLVLLLFRVEQFVLLVLSKNSWRDAVFFSVWSVTDCQATGDQRKVPSPLDFAYLPNCLKEGEGRKGKRWGAVDVLRSLSHLVRWCCLCVLLGSFSAFVLKRKNYSWSPRINLLQPFKGILPLCTIMRTFFVMSCNQQPKKPQSIWL